MLRAETNNKFYTGNLSRNCISVLSVVFKWLVRVLVYMYVSCFLQVLLGIIGFLGTYISLEFVSFLSGETFFTFPVVCFLSSVLLRL